MTSTSSHLATVRKYLDRYAAEEATLGAGLNFDAEAAGVYDHILVVPIRGEDPVFLDGYDCALAGVAGRSLVVVVVNTSSVSPERADEALCRQGLLATLGSAHSHLSKHVALWRRADHDVIVIDRASPGRELPGKGGVGMARKIGTDFALQLWASGKLRSPWIHLTDADARLPRDYFGACASLNNNDSDVSGAVAMVYAFAHGACDDVALTDAHSLYEISLRHYVLGLRRAGSPYAFHSIGSCIAVRAPALAIVRGVPKRQAGEDFYFLDKLAKIGRIAAPPLELGPIELTARRSARAPFGTGPAVEEISRLSDTENYLLHDPRIFETLATWLGVLDDCAAASSVEPYHQWLAILSEPVRAGVRPYLESQRALEAISDALGAGRAPATVRRRLHTWFDGLKTLRFVHAVRDSAFPKLPWRQALGPTAETPALLPSSLIASGTIAEVCDALRQLDVGIGSTLGEERVGWSSSGAARSAPPS